MKINNISIGLPCYNEEKNIESVISKCLNFISDHIDKNCELIIIDNNSTDNTVIIVKNIIKNNKNINIKLIENKKNIFYSGSANKIILNSKYDTVCIMDSDDQYDPYDIAKLYFFQKKKNLDLVIGKRTNRQDSILRKIISKIFLILSSILINNNLNDLNCGLRVLKKSKKIKKYINFELNFCNPEIFIKYKKNNLKIGEIKIKHFDRDYGKSIHNLHNLFKTFLTVIIYLIRLRNLKIK